MHKVIVFCMLLAITSISANADISCRTVKKDIKASSLAGVGMCSVGEQAFIVSCSTDRHATSIASGRGVKCITDLIEWVDYGICDEDDTNDLSCLEAFKIEYKCCK